MKRIIFLLFLLVPFVYVKAQIKVDVKGKITREADRRANKRTDKAINKAFDKVDEEIDSAIKKDDKEKKAESKDAQKVENKGESQKLPSAGVDSSSKVNRQPVLLWAKYDFVPGEKIFFEDNQENEQNGEFPSRWDLASGGGVENAVFDNQKVIYFREDGAFIVPYVQNPQNDYLPDQFTIEFDAWFEKGDYAKYWVELYDAKNQERGCK